MGTRIEAVAVQTSRAPGARRLSDGAARACLAQARRDAGELNLLVNAGLYKDRNMAEPALASIIQEDIGANPGHPPRPGRHGTFSFDVMNGGCGVVTALEIIDGFVKPGTARLGMVVAADADPAPRTSRGYVFPPVGGAILLGHCGDEEGFAGFQDETFPEDADLFEARLRYEPPVHAGLLGRRGRSVLEVHEDPRFAAVCVERATAVCAAFLDRMRQRVAGIDLLVASAHPAGFAAAVAAAIGLPADRVPDLGPELAGAHTAGPIAALASAAGSGQLARARNVLFLTAGAGLTIAAALYRR